MRWLTAAILLLASPSIAGERQIPSFPASVQIVNVFVTATQTGTGRHVPDLNADDFIVMEDGVRQNIVHFECEDVGASIVLLLDVSASTKRARPIILEAARRFLNTLRPTDEVQVAQFGDHYGLLADFTDDRQVQQEALKHVFLDGETKLNASLYTAARFLMRRRAQETERRRVMVVLTDGEDTASGMTSEPVLDEVRRTGVLVYVVHVLDPLWVLEPRKKAARKYMVELTETSGGRLFTVMQGEMNEIKARSAAAGIIDVYESIGRELGTQYHLAYTPTNDSTDGRWREIGIVCNRIGVTLRYRQGYFAPRR